MDQRRKHYRVWYPDHHRPVLQLGGKRFNVAELSEKGARIVPDSDAPDAPEIPRGERFRARMHFVDGGEVGVTARFLRVDGPHLVLQLLLGVSLRRMISEQMRLRRVFGAA